ncbi:MAG: DNA-binding transcriptional regulator [Pirellulales bacterium]|nr:DNA-binding transcriptional regulator [Pirellulales bacterium]
MHRREVALIVDPGRPYDRHIVRGVAAFVEEQHRHWSLYVEEDPVARLPDLKAWGGDGIIANFDDRRIATAVRRTSAPIVGVGGGYGYYPGDPDIPYVRTDNRAIAELAANHLFDMGLRRFAFCGEPPNRANGWARERAEAFVSAIEAAGCECDVYNGRHSPSRRWRESQTQLQRWLESLATPLGLMACNDARARHVMQACCAAGLRVPEDVAIVGVDNDDVMCELTQPRLTSIEQGARRIGFEAASLLDQMMSGKKPPRKSLTVPPARIVTRQSTDVLAINDPDVAEALRFIRRRACEPIAVHDVLTAAQMSRSTLEARFRDVLGRSIHAEIRRVQVDAARRLLTTTNIPIKEVVKRVGVSSVQYFSAMMRRSLGKTPGELRKESQRGQSAPS